MSRLNSVIKQVETESTEKYRGYKAAEIVEEFTKNDLSRGYVKMIRDRLKPGYEGEDRQAAEWTLRYITNRLLRVLSPFTPYLTDYLWTGEESIHMKDYPEVEEDMIDHELERNMELFQDIEQAVARLRQDQGISLRHPVQKVTVSGSEEVKKAVEDLRDLLKERLNSKEVEFEQVELDYEVKLDYSKAGPELGDQVGEVESELA
jgi:isoleucyl-tRNA synthetase